MYVLGDQHRPLEESLEVEFKEFCLIENDISSDEIYDIVKKGKITNKLNFNNEIYKTIKHYFYKYIPKYTSAFINAGISGDLIFGVNDFGEITGIPFIGSKNKLQTFIDNISITHLIKPYYPGIITYKVDELILDLNYLDDISEKLLKKYYMNVKERENIIKKYKHDRIVWVNKMNEYTCKLPLLLSTKKHEFENYLNIHAPQHLNYVIKQNEMRNIAHLKNDPTHYIYWLMQFKDCKLQKIKNTKPQMPELPRLVSGPKYLFKHLTNLRYNIVKYNKHISYYIININININISHITKSILYFDIEKNMWLKKIRKIHKNQPVLV